MARNVALDKAREMERRERIIRESFRLFSERGIEGVSMLQIVKAAGISELTIYHYYGNKPNLAIAVSTKVWSDVWE